MREGAVAQLREEWPLLELLGVRKLPPCVGGFGAWACRGACLLQTVRVDAPQALLPG